MELLPTPGFVEWSSYLVKSLIEHTYYNNLNEYAKASQGKTFIENYFVNAVNVSSMF